MRPQVGYLCLSVTALAYSKLFNPENISSHFCFLHNRLTWQHWNPAIQAVHCLDILRFEQDHHLAVAQARG